MNLMDKIQRSWQLLRTSVTVIRENPRLLWFPLWTSIFTTFIALFFLGPVIFIPTGHALTEGAHWEALWHKLCVVQSAEGAQNTSTITLQPWMAVYLGGLYLVSMFAATFCNVAFTSEILAALNGDPVSLRHGLRVAAGRFKSILVWSLFAGVVGLIIRQIEERLSFVGRILAGVIGLAWSVACVFVIPIIIREAPMANPVRILGKSAGTIKRTWGELLTGYLGLQGANLLALYVSLLFIGVAVLAAVLLKSVWVLVPFGLAWLVSLVAYSYLAGVAGQVYRCALYIYASEGTVPGPYNKEMLDLAWKVKKTPAA
jgi:hypothetical protein